MKTVVLHTRGWQTSGSYPGVNPLSCGTKNKILLRLRFSKADLRFHEECMELVWEKEPHCTFFLPLRFSCKFSQQMGIKKKGGRRREQFRSWDTVFKTFASLFSTTCHHETTMVPCGKKSCRFNKHLSCRSRQRLAGRCISICLEII